MTEKDFERHCSWIGKTTGIYDVSCWLCNDDGYQGGTNSNTRVAAVPSPPQRQCESFHNFKPISSMNLMMAHSSSTQFVNLRLNMVRSAFVSLLWQTFTSHVTGGHFLDRWRRNFCNISLWVGFNRHWLWRWWEDHWLNSISRSITCKESHIASSFVVCKRKFHGPRVEIRWLHHFCSLNLWFGGSNYHFWKKQVRTNPSVISDIYH